jgi:predicted DCC family thiol-disulfide oxidoreductase YuxK
MRLAFAVCVAVQTAGAQVFSVQPHPNGIAHLVDLTFLAAPGFLGASKVAVYAGLAAYVLGVLSPVALLAPVLFWVAVGTLFNSQGAINHSFQLFVLVMVAQLVMAWVRTIRNGGLSFRDGAQISQEMARGAVVVICALYMTAAFSKLHNTKGRWLLDSPNLAVQVVKTHSDAASDKGPPVNSFFGKHFPEWVVEHRGISRVLFAPGLLLELFACLAVLGRRWSLVLGIGLTTLHALIGRMMNLHFELYQYMLLIFLVNLPYWGLRMADAAARWWIRFKASPGLTWESGHPAVLFYDDDCGFCSLCVRWFALRAAAVGIVLKTVGYGELGAGVDYPGIDPAHRDNGIQWRRPDGFVWKDADAVAEALEHLPGYRVLGAGMRLPLIRNLCQIAYRSVARNRRWISQQLGLGACKIPALKTDHA